MKYKEDSVVENEMRMKEYVLQELKKRGYSKTHCKKDYFEACSAIVSPAAKAYAKKTEVSQMAYRMEASLIIMDYIDPLC